jgi:SPX domain protein involved in polyphosphate accumulation
LTAQPSVIPDTFERIEDKFIVRKEMGPWLVRMILQHMKPSYPDPTTDFTLIQSLYLDSPDLWIYTSHFEAELPRIKLRLRQYAPNGVWRDDLSLVELKSKKDGVSSKVRFKLGYLSAAKLSQGKTIPLTASLLRLNNEMNPTKLAKRLARVNELIREHKLRPQCSVTYHRQAFEGDGIRLTIDSDIQSKIMSELNRERIGEFVATPDWDKASLMRKLFLKDDYLLIEVKHSGLIPRWTSEMLSQFSAEQVSFSKYCFSVSQEIVRNLPEASQ